MVAVLAAARGANGVGDALAEDDPALRVLGPHGQRLEGVLRELRAAAGVASDRVGLYVAMAALPTASEDLAPALAAARDADGAFDLDAFYAGAYRQIHPLWPLTTLGNVAVGQLAIDLDVRGDNLVVTADAAAGARVLLEARAALEMGAVDRALAAGVGPDGAAAVLLARQADATAARVLLRGGATAFGVEAGALLEAAARDAGETTPPPAPAAEAAAGAEAPAAWLASALLEGGGAGTRVFLARTPDGAAGCLIAEVRP